jgi:hypothetical protein
MIPESAGKSLLSSRVENDDKDYELCHGCHFAYRIFDRHSLMWHMRVCIKTYVDEVMLN